MRRIWDAIEHSGRQWVGWRLSRNDPANSLCLTADTKRSLTTCRMCSSCKYVCLPRLCYLYPARELRIWWRIICPDPMLTSTLPQRNLNNAFAYDLVPSIGVMTAALKAARRVNDFPTAVRVFEGPWHPISKYSIHCPGLQGALNFPTLTPIDIQVSGPRSRTTPNTRCTSRSSRVCGRSSASLSRRRCIPRNRNRYTKQTLPRFEFLGNPNKNVLIDMFTSCLTLFRITRSQSVESDSELL